MGGDEKSRRRKRRHSRSPSPFQDEEEKSRKRRKRKGRERKSRKDESGGKERKKEKKRDKSLKHSSSRDGKEKKSKEKHKRSRKDSAFAELSKDDYFAKNNEFATWLKEERGIFFSDLSADAAREMFSTFVKEWNSQKLQPMYYEGIASGPRTAHNWKIKHDKGVQGL